jgi:hypothetical protein
VGTVFFFVAAFSPNLPMYGDSLTDWGRWAPAHQLDARHIVGVLLLAYLLYMVFAVFVAILVRGDDSISALLVQVATVAVGVKFAIELIQVSVLSVPAWTSLKDFGGSMSQLGGVLSTASLVPHAVFLSAVAASALISRTLPAWLAWFTAAVGVIQVTAMLLAFTWIPPGPIVVALGTLWFTSIPAWPLVT